MPKCLGAGAEVRQSREILGYKRQVPERAMYICMHIN